MNEMNDKDRIRLAEAMGWRRERVEGHAAWFDPHGKRYPVASLVLENPFDPFTDANDDYAVLEWIRTRVNDPREDIKRSMMRNMVRYNIEPIKYQVGDYARAALKVLDND